MVNFIQIVDPFFFSGPSVAPFYRNLWLSEKRYYSAFDKPVTKNALTDWQKDHDTSIFDPLEVDVKTKTCDFTLRNFFAEFIGDVDEPIEHNHDIVDDKKNVVEEELNLDHLGPGSEVVGPDSFF